MKMTFQEFLEQANHRTTEQIADQLYRSINEIEALKAKVAEFDSKFRVLQGLISDKPDGSIEINIASVKADAIREATLKLEFDEHVMVCSSDSLMEYADKLEKGDI